MQTPSFGAVIKEADIRDYDLHKVNESLGHSGVFQPSHNDYSSIPNDFQGQIPACGSHAGSFFKNLLSLNAKTGHLHSSPRYLWHYIKKIDAYKPEDGTDINSIFRTLRKQGNCKFELTGNDVNLSLPLYTWFTPTAEMDTDASGNQTTAEAFTYKPSWEQICQNIDLHGGCVGLLKVGRNMYLPSWNESDILPLSPTRYPMDNGHFIVFTNYDDKYIYFRNSWGVSWGHNGDGYIDRSYLPYVVAIGVALDKSKVPPEAIPAPVIVDGQVTNWKVRWLWLLKAAKALGLYKSDLV